MPTVSVHNAPLFEAGGGTTITGLAAPSRGARDVALWRVRFAPNAASPTHSLTREETFLVLSGSVTARFADHVETANPGDALIVPAGAEFSLVAADGPAEAICAMPVGGQAVTADGAFTPPWAQ
ncbi:MAG TPA: cupin domain-containing protein [Jatrophihabitans sp.]|nr:cupin domain-containing protein [Jatrophihabitans sp.]